MLSGPIPQQGGNHQCNLVHPGLPENAHSPITLLQHALHSSLSRSGDKGHEKSRSGLLKDTHPPMPSPNQTSILTRDLLFLYALSCATCCKGSPNF